MGQRTRGQFSPHLWRVAASATVLGLAMATTPAAAASSDGPALVTSRGEIRPSCQPPRPFPGSQLIGAANRSGLRVWTYRTSAGSPLSVLLYYLRALPPQGFGVAGWGIGGNPKESSGGLNARSRACGYLGFAASGQPGPATTYRVCTATTQRAWTWCADGRNP